MSFLPVTSWPTITTPTTSPRASFRVVAFSSNSTRLPSRAYSGSSKLSVEIPCIASVSTSANDVRNSVLITSASTSTRPSISAVL